ETGSCGVTLFFVLSGYLITGILKREIDRTGKVAFKRFYQRRARRLLPALVLLLAAVTVGGGLQIIPHLLPIVLYSSNYFLGASQGPLSIPPSLSQTWSLGVEEQFYLLWPVVLVVLARLLGLKRTCWAVLIAVVILGLWREVLWLQSANPARLFFSSDGRASELLVGCLVALMPPLRARAPVTVGALIAIVAFSLLHPQALFVPIVVGGGMLLGTTTALVIATVTERSTAGRILSWAPLRGIGLV